VIDHGERHFSIYGNLERADVKVGDNVPRSAPLGPVAPRGSDGALLYFELRKDGRAIEPAPWFGL
jgi:septal ring factor EnvC (AmiA/AmiB activator)